MKKQNKQDSGLFYLTYANLLAGLLFVFLLIIVVLLLKNSLVKTEIVSEQKNLKNQKEKFELEKKEFVQSQNRLYELGEKLGKDFNISTLSIQDKEFLTLLAHLNEKEEQLSSFRADFNKLKDELNGFGVQKSALILELQAKLDSQITLDLDTASMNLNANMLFDEGSYVLKEDVKARLKQVLTEYFDLLLKDENLALSIENIIIETYSNEGSSFAYRLDLSSRRAFELMSFIFSFYKDERLEKLLLVSPKIDNKDSYIKIDFSISNQALLKRLEQFFDAR
ncbi:hypothetical protein [Campylobacter sp. MIT 97-5078]|uniref:hypothetical protein n=1 Tax=Campylobacter sp. MIT 97-5078 TaxID=1548153 RepID=UPI000513360C|nr:hypothetical protein [Campylobacter sp. MIT 97-5078]KGI56151.1 hypothetical protein LR59_08735 [Campylobacter sp. MIT 97-5078]TQR27964.1 hypothetical protein DMB91_01645 [Campylobacter sp. MIT 97-5078]